MKKILIANTLRDDSEPIMDIFKNLDKEKYLFELITTGSEMFEKFKKNKWPTKKFYLGQNLNKKLNQIFFLAILPLIYLFYFLVLAQVKLTKKINLIICLNINEKLIISPIAKLLGIKIIWIEQADSIFLKTKTLNKLIALLYKTYSKWARIVVFNSVTKTLLGRGGMKESNITIIYPGIKLNQHEHQDNLFIELAQSEGKNFRQKFFTIGTITNLNKKQRIETLLQAIKICLIIIPNIQLIIIGDGAERKNLSWMAQKMGIDNLTWFVGEQAHPKKWLDSFNIFIETTETPQLTTFNTLLQAMLAKLPIIGPKNLGLEDIITDLGDQSGCLVDAESGEALARQIIKLWRDKGLRTKLGQTGKEKVETRFNLEKQIFEFEKIIN